LKPEQLTEEQKRQRLAEDEALNPAMQADLARVLTAAGYEFTAGCIMPDRGKGKLRAYPTIAATYEHARRLSNASGS
jgi:hypothetical protein